jgi:hypothetical protein
MAKPTSIDALLGRIFYRRESEYEIERRRENARARYHAKRLSKKLGIPLTIGRDDSGWNCWVETDLVPDERFCSSWHEVDEVLTECERIIQEREAK